MSQSASHLRLVSSNGETFSRQALARQFRQIMTEHIRAHTDGTNVNPVTLLATDYLNHFSEAIMLLEMLPDAPAELAAELAGWRHETYEEHFQRSGFRDKSLAIAGYRNAPEDVREAFDTVTANISGELSDLLADLQAHMQSGDLEALDALCADAVPRLQSKLETAIAVVNGEIGTAQDAISDSAHDAGTSQAAVDALFD